MIKLDESLGFILNRAAFAMRWALEERLKKYDITAPQWAVLARLWERDGQSPSAIGKSLHFDKPTATGIIDRLEKKGLVKKLRDSEDRRSISVYLTEKGMKMENLLPKFAREVNRLASKGINKNEVERLKILLRKIWNNCKE